MSAQRDRVEAVFNAALALTTSESRADFVREQAKGDAELERRVRALLAAHEAQSGFLPLPPERSTTDALPAVATEGEEIGQYKLLEQIGEGGFGVVFLAEQRAPIRRRVALKILKPGMDSRQVIARFQAERQALALMDHPNIAKVLDAGATAVGRPYFVMELVKGIAITDYCNECSLTTEAQLQLFMSVCDAVQHAHQKGVIHRDIKPSNVLVAMAEGFPQVKVIDFGVAKAINQRLTDESLHTGFAQMIGTPLYMSPEQAEMSPLEIDTRGDIYSLGVLLYELLTGTTPFERERMQKASFDEMRRIIREEEPVCPSSRLSTFNAQAASTSAKQRRTEPRRLIQTVRGDLDWIVMKCLEKDRGRRYPTAAALVDDIQCYLSNKPVSASPPSLSYRIGKLIRRNRLAFAAGAAMSLTLAFAAAFSSVMYFKERAAREKAVASDDRTGQTMNLFVEIVAGAGTSFIDVDPLLLQDLLNRADSTTDAAQALNNIGLELRQRRRFAEAERFQQQTLKILNHRIPGDVPEKAMAYNNLALTQTDQGKFAAAQQNFKKGLEIGERVWKTEPWNLAKLETNQGMALRLEGRFSDAREVLETALQRRQESLGNRHVDIAESELRLGELDRDEGDPAAAQMRLENALQIWRQNPASPPAAVYGATIELADALLASANYAKAKELAAGVLQFAERRDPDAWETAYTRTVLGGAYLGLGEKEKAGKLLREGYEGMLPYLESSTVATRSYFRTALVRLIEYSRAIKDDNLAAIWQATLQKLDESFAAKLKAASEDSTTTQ
jgi:eukaryotic-like serine/threonine-protein kinase